MNYIDPRLPGATSHRVRYDGRQGALVGIVLGNTVLTLLTLGFFRFWATTRVRRYVWSHVRLDGERFEYTGTGLELFLGFLIAVAVLAPANFLFDLLVTGLLTGSSVVARGLDAAKLVILWYLMLVALYRARRYRLTRTQWRAIRAGQTGSALRYGLLGLGWWFLTIVSLGLVTPVRRVRMASYRMNNTWFGDSRFGFDARARELMGAWMRNWLLFIPTLGLSYFWYRAAEQRYFAEHTRLNGAAFRLDLRGGRLVGIFLPYLLSIVGAVVALAAVQGWLIFGRGAGAPQLDGTAVLFAALWVVALVLIIPMLYYGLVMHRLVRYLTEALEVDASLDLLAITQAQSRGRSAGEGLAGALNVGEI